MRGVAPKVVEGLFTKSRGCVACILPPPGLYSFKVQGSFQIGAIKLSHQKRSSSFCIQDTLAGHCALDRTHMLTLNTVVKRGARGDGSDTALHNRSREIVVEQNTRRGDATIVITPAWFVWGTALRDVVAE